MAVTVAMIRQMINDFPKGTRLAGHGKQFMIDPLPMDELSFQLDAGSEGMCLRGSNVAERVAFDLCDNFKIGNDILDRSDYSIEGEGEAIIFRAAPVTDTTFSFRYRGPKHEPMTFHSVPLLSRKKGRYTFSDEQLEELAKESVGEQYPIEKLRDISDDPRISYPYTHCVVLEAFVGEKGIYATMEMRTGEEMDWK